MGQWEPEPVSFWAHQGLGIEKRESNFNGEAVGKSHSTSVEEGFVFLSRVGGKKARRHIPTSTNGP